MPSYSGQSLIFQWIYSGGTINLNTDFRTATYSPSIDQAEDTAGADTNKTYVNLQKDGKVSFGGLMQTGGTTTTVGLVEGTSGTIIIGPEGTASGKQKLTIPAISLGANYNWPYNGLVEISCDFQQNGARTDGSY